MAKEVASYTTPGGGTVSLHHGGMLAAISGSGAWYECTACPGRTKVTNWSNSAQADLVDYDATQRAAENHAANCRRKPRR